MVLRSIMIIIRCFSFAFVVIELPISSRILTTLGAALKCEQIRAEGGLNVHGKLINRDYFYSRFHKKVIIIKFLSLYADTCTPFQRHCSESILDFMAFFRCQSPLHQ